MKNKIENASIADLKNGFILTERFIDKAKIYTCLFCHVQYDADDIYQFKKLLVNGKKAIKMHIRESHGEVFDNLLSQDKAQTGLTDTQKDFLVNYYSGMPDKEIAEKMNISASTVRYQRYNFREKAKRAKMILALAELLEEQEEKLNIWAKQEKPADENSTMLETLFDSIEPLVLKTFDFGKKKDERRNFILKTIVSRFEKDRKYTNKEVDAILKEIYHDYATIRRHLIEDGFMERTSDNREYWMK